MLCPWLCAFFSNLILVILLYSLSGLDLLLNPGQICIHALFQHDLFGNNFVGLWPFTWGDRFKFFSWVRDPSSAFL